MLTQHAKTNIGVVICRDFNSQPDGGRYLLIKGRFFVNTINVVPALVPYIVYRVPFLHSPAHLVMQVTKVVDLMLALGGLGLALFSFRLVSKENRKHCQF